MSKKVELKLKRIKLVHAGKNVDAFKVLQEYWELCKNPSIKTEKVIVEETILKKDIKIQSTIKKGKFTKLSDLSKIKGIGKETVKDISSIYNSIESLKEDIKSKKSLPFRNDIVVKLSKVLI